MLPPVRTDDAALPPRETQLPVPNPVPGYLATLGRHLPDTSDIEIDDSIGSSYAESDANAARSARSRGPSILAGWNRSSVRRMDFSKANARPYSAFIRSTAICWESACYLLPAFDRRS